MGRPPVRSNALQRVQFRVRPEMQNPTTQAATSHHPTLGTKREPTAFVRFSPATDEPSSVSFDPHLPLSPGCSASTGNRP